jgi:hypothetical protein
MAKQSKNIAKVQDMLDDNFQRKIQVGMGSVGNGPNDGHKVGDTWTDSDGKEWVQKDGYYTNVTKFATRGLGDNCSGCKKFIRKPWDKDVYKADGRCYHCQMNYELDLSFDKPIRWFAYRRLKDFQNMKAIERDMDQWFEEKEKWLQENPFDTKVANALANGEVEMTINKNKM